MIRIKSVVNKLIGLTAIVGVICWCIYIYSKETGNASHFHNNAIFSIVVASKLYHGRTVQVMLKEGSKLYFLPPLGNKIALGDSIAKPPNTYIYDVYRRNENGVFIKSHTYNFKTYY
ncbi:MAG TPA: hypothetical protein VL098_09515 [Flavipsychrobacter sp.]|nr:hypothetical protein [Flavipsychrobacter sp.]